MISTWLRSVIWRQGDLRVQRLCTSRACEPWWLIGSCVLCLSDLGHLHSPFDCPFIFFVIWGCESARWFNSTALLSLGPVMEEKIVVLRDYCNSKSRGLLLTNLVPKLEDFLKQDERSIGVKIETVLLPSLESVCNDSNDHEFRMKCLDIIQVSLKNCFRSLLTASYWWLKITSLMWGLCWRNRLQLSSRVSASCWTCYRMWALHWWRVWRANRTHSFLFAWLGYLLHSNVLCLFFTCNWSLPVFTVRCSRPLLRLSRLVATAHRWCV
jgi:hypothetical protein